MARIRTIKPEFWSDEKLAPLSVTDRLVFLGLISFADDGGRLVDNVKSIDGMLFPETDDSSRESLERLARAGRILRYRSESGQRLIQIVNWQRHQRVDNPSKHTLPAPPATAAVTADPPTTSDESPEGLARPERDSREDVPRPSLSDLGPRTKDQGPGSEEPRSDEPPRASAAARPPLVPQLSREQLLTAEPDYAPRRSRVRPELGGARVGGKEFTEPTIPGVPPGWAVKLALVWNRHKGNPGPMQAFADAMVPVVEASMALGFELSGAEKAIAAAIDDAKAEARTKSRPELVRFCTPTAVSRDARYWVEAANKSIAAELQGTFVDQQRSA